MTTKTMTNAIILRLMQAMTDEIGLELRKKRLPVTLVYAMRRSISELEKVYGVYESTLKDICTQYNVSMSDFQNDEECAKEVVALLNLEVELPVHTVPTSVIEGMDGTYDPLTYEEMDRLFWLLEE